MLQKLCFWWRTGTSSLGSSCGDLAQILTPYPREAHLLVVIGWLRLAAMTQRDSLVAPLPFHPAISENCKFGCKNLGIRG